MQSVLSTHARVILTRVNMTRTIVIYTRRVKFSQQCILTLTNVKMTLMKRTSVISTQIRLISTRRVRFYIYFYEPGMPSKFLRNFELTCVQKSILIFLAWQQCFYFDIVLELQHIKKINRIYDAFHLKTDIVLDRPSRISL
jgi:hypothetical protein